MILVYKIATTGMPLWRAKDDDPEQPHMVALTGLLCDEDAVGTVKATIDCLIAPKGWVIPVPSTAIHGVEQHKAEQHGIPEDQALGMLFDLQARAGARVAHNEQFDARIVSIARARYPHVQSQEWDQAQAICSMRSTLEWLAATDGKTFYGRTAKLEVLHQRVTGKDAPIGRSTMARAYAARDVFFGVKAALSEGSAFAK